SRVAPKPAARHFDLFDEYVPVELAPQPEQPSSVENDINDNNNNNNGGDSGSDSDSGEPLAVSQLVQAERLILSAGNTTPIPTPAPSFQSLNNDVSSLGKKHCPCHGKEASGSKSIDGADSLTTPPPHDTGEAENVKFVNLVRRGGKRGSEDPEEETRTF